MIVWLASYPRSGNTFLRVILNKIFNIQTYSIYNDRVDIGADEKTSDVVGHQFLPEDFDLSKARDEDKFYFIKTHELPDERIGLDDKVIYLLRDGRESVLSFIRFVNNYGDKTCTSEDVIFGAIFNGGWGEHVKEWAPNKRANTLLIKFEELIEDPERYVNEMSEFLTIKPVADSIPGFQDLKDINPKFFSSGKKDSWKTEYSEGEHISFWLKNYSQMIDYGYKDDIPDVIKSHQEFSLFKQLSAENTYLLKEIFGIKDEMANIVRQNKIVVELRSMVNMRDQEIEGFQQRIHEQQQRIREQNDELNTIKNDSAYRFISKLSELFRINK